MKYYKTVLLPIRVSEGDYCWDCNQRICPYFDNEGGHPSCKLDIDNIDPLKCDEEGRVPKPESCLKLKKA